MCSRSNWKRFLVGQHDTLNRGLYVSPYVIAWGLFVIADTVAGYFMSHHAYLARGLYVSGTLCLGDFMSVLHLEHIYTSLPSFISIDHQIR